jgi:plasmid stabilization system protein ParE
VESLRFDAVKPKFDPEPTPEEREALEEALRRLLDPPAEPRSAWWRRGIEENLEEGEEEP